MDLPLVQLYLDLIGETMDYNVEYQTTDIEVVQDNTIDLSYSVELNDVAYDMTGMQLDIQVRTKDVANTLVISWSSAGTSPVITISTNIYNIYAVGIADVGKYEYDVKLTSGSDVSTIQRGNFYVIEKRTV